MVARRRSSSKIAMTLASALMVGATASGSVGSSSNLRGGGNGPADSEMGLAARQQHDQSLANDLRFMDPFEGFDYDQVIDDFDDFDMEEVRSLIPPSALAEDDRILFNVDIDDERSTKHSKHGGHHREPSPDEQQDMPEAISRIVGGENARLSGFALTLDKRSDGKRYRGVCGACMISRRWAVTAAHCISNYVTNDYRDRLDALYIGGEKPWQTCLKNGVAEKNCGSPYQIIDVDDIIVHPQHVPGAGSAYDIALIKLVEDVNLSKFPDFEPLPLIDYKLADSDEGRDGHVYGFGQVGYGMQKSNELLSVNVPFVKESTCRQQMSDWVITDQMICFGGGDDGKDSCGGDSGGPLLFEGSLTGIVSWGYMCAEPNYPGVYANVYNLQGFITAHADGYSLQSRDGAVTHKGTNSYLKAPANFALNDGGAPTSTGGTCIDMINPGNSNHQVYYFKKDKPRTKTCSSVGQNPSSLCNRKLQDPISAEKNRVENVCCHACRDWKKSSEGNPGAPTPCVDMSNPGSSDHKVYYFKNDNPRTKTCSSVGQNPSSLCNKKLQVPISAEKDRVRNVCCHACRDHQTK